MVFCLRVHLVCRNGMRILSADDVLAALPMEAAIAGMRRAFAAFSSGRVEMPPSARLQVPGGRGEGSAALVHVQNHEGEVLGLCLTTSWPENPVQGRPVGQGAVLLVDPATGAPDALVDAGSLSAVRTGATSAVATDLLARRSARTLAVIGTGVQARTQVEGICHVRTIDSVHVYGRDPSSIRTFISEMAGQGRIPREVIAAKTPAAAIAGADIICTATTSSTPVFADRDLQDGVHINGIGSFSPSTAEIPHRTLARALVVVDSRTAALSDAGDLVQAIARGAITADHIRAELGELVVGRVQGRTSPEQVTVFKSVGLAVQDTVAASIALKNARAGEIGRECRWP